LKKPRYDSGMINVEEEKSLIHIKN
jgi:hypothetical protein